MSSEGSDHVRARQAGLDAHRGYYRLVLDAAREGVRDRLSPLETARRCELGAFAELPDAQRIILNLHRAYTDIGSCEFDLIQGITDTVTYNSSPIDISG